MAIRTKKLLKKPSAEVRNQNMMTLIRKVHGMIDNPDIEKHRHSQDQVGALLEAQGVNPYILSTEACAICDRCAILDGLPCRHPDKMHPCVESHGINVIPVLEQCGMEFQYAQNVVTWMSLLFY